MMLNTGLTFITTLFTLYSIFQYFIQKVDSFKSIFLLHVHWFIYYSLTMIVHIYSANKLKSEVCELWTFNHSLQLIQRTKTRSDQMLVLLNEKSIIDFNYFVKGKRIAWIAHDISNCCDDPNVVLAVYIYSV